MNTVDQTHRQVSLITFALISGMTIFAVVVGVLHSGGSIDPTLTASATLRLVAAVIGVGLLATAHLITPRPGSAPGASSRGGENPGGIVSGTIVPQAIREGVGMLGGMVGFLTGDLLLMGALVAAAAASMVVGLPSRDEIRRRLGSGHQSPPRDAP